MRERRIRTKRRGEDTLLHIPRILAFPLRFMSEASRAAMPSTFSVSETQFPCIYDT
jgi:hypothetical protein